MTTANAEDCGKCLYWNNDNKFCKVGRDPDMFGICLSKTNKHILKAFGWLTEKQKEMEGVSLYGKDER